jgi:TPR repeat protein
MFFSFLCLGEKLYTRFNFLFHCPVFGGHRTLSEFTETMLHYRQLEHHADAIRELKLALDNTPQKFSNQPFRAELHLLRGFAYRTSGNEAAAQEDLKQVRQIHPWLPESFLQPESQIAKDMRLALIPKEAERHAAIFRLALMHQKGTEGVPKDEKRAQIYFGMGLDKDQPEAHLPRARMLVAQKKYATAASYYQKIAAAANHPDRKEATFELGSLYENQQHAEPDQRNLFRARTMYLIAIELGHPHAMNNLGKLYLKGQIHANGTTGGTVTEEDKSAGAALIERAQQAAPEDGLINYDLGLCYYTPHQDACKVA